MVRKYCNTKNKTLSVLIYLYFHMTPEHYVYSSIDNICLELNLSTKSHGARRNQNVIKDILKDLESQNIIRFDDRNFGGNIDELNNNQLFKIEINVQATLLNPSSNYVYVDITEYQAIMKSPKYTYKVFNVFCQIKSHVCMDNNCLHICYPSIKTLCKLCGCSDDTLFSLLKIMYYNQLLYVYRLEQNEIDLIKQNIEYVFALEKYDRDAILNEFIA